MKNNIKNIFKHLLCKSGYEIKKIDQLVNKFDNYHHSMPTLFERMGHAEKIGFQPKQIVDAGAYTGGWTMQMLNIFASSKFMLIEPNPHVQKTIIDNLSEHKDKITIIKKAASNKSGKMSFNIWGDPATATSASLQSHVRGDAENVLDIEVDTLDNLMQLNDFQPELVKLDLQGAEITALEGAAETLRRAEMFVVEFGCLEAYIDRATPRQLMDIFYDNDYCLYDIVDCHYRPYDGAMTGGDFFFVKNWSALRKHKGWD